MAAKKSPSGIHIKKKNVGKLRKKMGAPKGKNIPLSELKAKLAAAKKAGNTALIKQLVFAINARKWGK